MSLFRRPKKPIQRRVFSSYGDDGDDDGNNDGGGGGDQMDTDEITMPVVSSRSKKAERPKETSAEKLPKKTSLLSFDDEGNLFI